MAKKTSFKDLINVMKRLRAPDGCPWDREQTHQSLLRYLKEESQEVFSAVKKKDWDNLQEELGDVLLQILFHAQIAAERGKFSIHDVLHTLRQKMVNRHPHVFGRGKKTILTSADVVNRWKELKARDKALRQKKS